MTAGLAMEGATSKATLYRWIVDLAGKEREIPGGRATPNPNMARDQAHVPHGPMSRDETEHETAPGADVVLNPAMVDGELRILEVDLAVRLGFAAPRSIRKLIKRWLPELDKLGPRSTVDRVVNGGEAEEFYLNRKQAIFITGKSDTPEASAITIEIIERFEAYEKQGGQAIDFNDPRALRTALLSYSERVIALEGKVADAERQVADRDRVIERQAPHPPFRREAELC